MNTTLNLNSNRIARSHPADRSTTFVLPVFTRLFLAIARLFSPGDDPAAIHYIKTYRQELE